MAFETKSNEATGEYISWIKGSGAMNEILSPPGPWELKEVRLHLSADGGTSENFTITENADEGPEFYVVHLATDMETTSDVVQTYYNKEKHFGHKDNLQFTYANTNSKVWGLKVIYTFIRS